MNSILQTGFALSLAAGSLGAFAQGTGRPAITSISHIAIYSADAAATEHFYMDQLGARKSPDPENPKATCYFFSSQQYVEVLPLPEGQGISRLAHIGYNTTNAESLRKFLLAHGSTQVTELQTSFNGMRWFGVKDPEGNDVQFIQQSSPSAIPTSGAISTRIIHVGFLVHSREVEDKFYKDVLGFRPYWYGAMKEGATDWVSQQVPEGHDWLEYMLVGDGSTTPLDHVDARELGVLNHFSLGVVNMEETVTKLYTEDKLSPRHDGPQMGKDGKWQANMYDPDGTRVEFMEFQPVMKPCCSNFTAMSPTN